MRPLPSSAPVAAVQAAVLRHQHHPAAAVAVAAYSLHLLLCHFSTPCRLHITSLWLVRLATQYQRTVVVQIFCISDSLHLSHFPHRLLHLLLLLLPHLLHLPFPGPVLLWLEHNHTPVKLLLPREPWRWRRRSPGDVSVRPGRERGEGGEEGGGGQAPELHLPSLASRSKQYHSLFVTYIEVPISVAGRKSEEQLVNLEARCWDE